MQHINSTQAQTSAFNFTVLPHNTFTLLIVIMVNYAAKQLTILFSL